jgi:hypothetical protein
LRLQILAQALALGGLHPFGQPDEIGTTAAIKPAQGGEESIALGFGQERESFDDRRQLAPQIRAQPPEPLRIGRERGKTAAGIGLLGRRQR